MQKEMADEALVLAEVAKGNQLAFAKIFDFYRNKVFGYALALIQSESAAEEIVQQVFIKLWLKRQDLEEVSNFGAFLRVISRNETLNALKKNALAFKRDQLVFKEQEEQDFDAAHMIEYKETQKILTEAINHLPPQQKIVYEMCHVDGYKQKEVAEKLNISPLTVKVHLREAVKSVRSYLVKHSDMKALAVILYFLK